MSAVGDFSARLTSAVRPRLAARRKSSVAGHRSQQDPDRESRNPVRSLPAGIADIALASLTSFLVGIDAARHLDADLLGLWGLLFSAYLLASIVPLAFVLTPFEAALVARPGMDQLRALPHTAGLGALVGLPAAMAAMALPLAFSRDLDASTGWRLGVIGVVLGVTSPLQDHTRRLMHQVSWSNGAAATSAVQFTVAVVAVLGLRAGGLDDVYVPPLTLAASNVVSLAFALAVARVRARSGTRPKVALRGVFREGGWLLGAGIVDRATHSACLALISLWAGLAAAGAYEATRVAAQPVLVLALAVLSVYKPQMMRNAVSGRRQDARRTNAIFGGLVLGASIAYTVPVSFAWALNPLPWLMPAAFDHGGFLLAVLVATAISALAMAPTWELIGSSHARDFARHLISLSVAMVGVCVVALLAGVGVYAWPLAFGLRSVALLVQLTRESSRLYRNGDSNHEGADSGAQERVGPAMTGAGS